MEDNYIAAMLLAGVGDALGYKCGEWEFCFDGEKIHRELKALGGISKLSVKKPKFVVSDDTVLLLSTGESLVAQGNTDDLNKLYQELAFRYKRDLINDMDGRAAGLTTSNACHSLKPHQKDGWIIPFNSRGGGCGAAMRSMCIGLRYANVYDVKCLQQLIVVSVESGRMTHNHPTGFLGSLASAFFAALSVCKVPLERWGSLLVQLIPKALEYIELQQRDVIENQKAWPYFSERWKEYLEARNISSGETKPVFPDLYGVKERDIFYKSLSFSGWGGSSGHDAPMIAYDALLYAEGNWKTLCKHGMLHSGDNDSTGVISGFCYGAMYGLSTVPKCNYAKVEYHDRLKTVGKELFKLASRDGFLNLGDQVKDSVIPIGDLFTNAKQNVE